MQTSDRFNINSQLEHLQVKYVGTGHADLNRFEWAVNIQRDSFARSSGARNAPQVEPRGSRGRQRRRQSEVQGADAVGVDAAEPVGDEPRREASACGSDRAT
ncbi:hypothetical protein EUGRSUZ_L00218 [Eucalyptus grandis]|uniref:Uncharacterized protein n=1 Tax=Eucalyptus grandis TaxID=71139 RepID=A0A058ZX87_EUCGR|nr:hypothetical protein EUGRSUZ_L00218 [Eucalyptus grandis]